MVFGNLTAHSMLFLEYHNPGITNLIVAAILKLYPGTFRKLMTGYRKTFYLLR